jgi:hypothetical protein
MDIATLNQEYKNDVCLYSIYMDTIHCNNRAIGMILNLIKPDQFEHIDGKGTAQEAWDALAKEAC